MASVTLKQKTLLELWQNKSKTALTEGDLWIRLKKKTGIYVDSLQIL